MKDSKAEKQGSFLPKDMSFGEHVKSKAAYAFLATLFMAGFGVGAAIWSSSLAPIQLELTRTREDFRQVQAELNIVKSEYAQYRGQNREPREVDAASIPVTKSEGDRSRADAEQKSKQQTNVQSNLSLRSEDVRVSTGSTGEVFSGDVLVSLIATPFGGSPLRHTVMASASSPGYTAVQFNNKDVGEAAIITTKSGKYEVRIIDAGTFEAKFRVTVLPK